MGAANRAKTLSDGDFRDLMDFVHSTSAVPVRDALILLLSYKAGLRSMEIAGLDWGDVTDAKGRLIVPNITIPADIVKRGRTREVPMHSWIREMLLVHYNMTDVRRRGSRMPLLLNSRGQRLRPGTLQQYLRRLYIAAGFDGASSHSGRRTFITKAARVANKNGCSLKDVQLLAGHSDLASTEAYIDLSPRARDLVNAI